MKGTVHYAEDNNIALLKIDNPPVNPLSSGVRQGLYDGVSKALVAEHIDALVLTECIGHLSLVLTSVNSVKRHKRP